MIIEKLEKCAETVTEKLDKYLDLKDTDYKNLTDSMRYSVLSGGKRVRPWSCNSFCLFISKKRQSSRVSFSAAIVSLHKK